MKWIMALLVISMAVGCTALLCTLDPKVIPWYGWMILIPFVASLWGAVWIIVCECVG